MNLSGSSVERKDIPIKYVPEIIFLSPMFFLARGMPTDTMDDIELKNVELQYPLMRSLSRSDSYTQVGSFLSSSIHWNWPKQYVCES